MQKIAKYTAAVALGVALTYTAMNPARTATIVTKLFCNRVAVGMGFGLAIGLSAVAYRITHMPSMQGHTGMAAGGFELVMMGVGVCAATIIGGAIGGLSYGGSFLSRHTTIIWK